MSRKKLNENIRYYLLTGLIAIIVMIPFLWMISTSLKTRGSLTKIPIEWVPKNPTLDAYKQVFEMFPFSKAVFNSLFITISYTIITVISASMAAFAFTKIKFKFHNGLFKIYLASTMIPMQVTLIPLFIVMNKLHLINTYPSVILPSLFKAFGVFLMVQSMRSLPNDFVEAAKIDGAGLFRIYRQIVLPMCLPGVATLCITTFMESWNDYLWPLLMLTDKNKMTLTLALNSLNGQYDTAYNMLMAGSLLSMIPIIVVYIIAQVSTKNRTVEGGVKG